MQTYAREDVVAGGIAGRLSPRDEHRPGSRRGLSATPGINFFAARQAGAFFRPAGSTRRGLDFFRSIGGASVVGAGGFFWGRGEETEECETV